MNRYEKAMEEIKEPSGTPISWWKPAQDEVIGGRVTYLGNRETSYRESKVIEIETDEGEVFARTVNGALDSELKANDVQVGDVLALKFLGQKIAGASGRNYNTYAIRRLEASGERTTRQLVSEADSEFDDDLPF